MTDNFDRNFELLTGNPPFPWQQALFKRFIELDSSHRFPAVCDLPTGLGKTSVMAVWLLALAHHAEVRLLGNFPRRLVYVVNRRTVVDQSTREAEKLRVALREEPELADVSNALRGLSAHPWEAPLAISTLRGQFADNAEWRDDPARPAIIAGTVDMIGSRLLFSGYGRGFKSRPLHAAFLAQDALLVHDEAHLEPAFQKLLEAIVAEQDRSRDLKRLNVMELSATSRGDGSGFGLSDSDRNHPVVKARIHARKGIAIHPVDDQKRTAEEVLALCVSGEVQNSGQAVLVFLRRVDDVNKIADQLRKEGLATQTLTGTLRGYERDLLARADPIFARFLPAADRAVAAQSGTVFLVCTSAGEVGVNLSADHLICDLTPFDSMAQRLGRVNRFGAGDALIELVLLTSAETSDATGGKTTAMDVACSRTLALVRQLPMRQDGRYDASPHALAGLSVQDRLLAFTPAPELVPTSDILFDAWALTTLVELPGRPPVADWLHGISEWEPPETLVAWREEVELLSGDWLLRYDPNDLLEDYPLKPQELLRDRSRRVFNELEKLAGACPGSPTWLVDESGMVTVHDLSELIAAGEEGIHGCTVLLPPAAGGLHHGQLSGESPASGAEQHDVADLWLDENGGVRRKRVWDEEPPAAKMRLVRTLDLGNDEDCEPADEDEVSAKRRYWRWFVRPKYADDDGSCAARAKQLLTDHLTSTERFARALSERLLDGLELSAVVLAAKWHDLGKARRVWQRSIGNRSEEVLAKSGPGMVPLGLTRYRHEFGSLIDLQTNKEFTDLSEEARDLVMHLIAAHHGRARPCFPDDEVFDPEHPDKESRAIAEEVPRRFARLQRRYGRWGLAYLESLVRAADILASQAIGGTEAELGEAAE